MSADRGTCKGCGAAIIWIKNENGKPEPFDAKPARVLHVNGDEFPKGTVFSQANHPGQPWAGPDWELDVAHLPHFVTCPKAADFRRGRKESE